MQDNLFGKVSLSSDYRVIDRKLIRLIIWSGYVNELKLKKSGRQDKKSVSLERRGISYSLKIVLDNVLSKLERNPN